MRAVGWRMSSPIRGASPLPASRRPGGATSGGSGWLCQHLYDHYLFTRDRRFLQWAYPIMKGAAQFYADMLTEEPKHHWLVVAPANSPENHFLTQRRARGGHLPWPDHVLSIGPLPLRRLH